ncbi:DUF3422 family protein [Propylenella binzhouense]|uniref:DUF3422 domain-containing protein n=1 Tax=Propylenella binzhouense TaxID=2555902 RepID=A0A964T800_9HYPH|nr:DUF3422 domain-containing protein [Propylenella binzhouense]MYZ50228.1 DUF3422 domain-containing protein [Propylenella binzhouense]
MNDSETRREPGGEPSGGSGEAPLGAPYGLRPHPLRPFILGELHSRPFQLVAAPRTILQLAFLAESGPDQDAATVGQLARSRGLSGPDPEARHFAMNWGPGRLRWERHTEFTTWTWDAPSPADLDEPVRGHPFGDAFRGPGALVAAIRLDLCPGPSGEAELARFHPTSLCYSVMDGGTARAATDFRQDADGFTRILVFDDGLGEARAGALTQRLIEVETYRTLTLLGLPVAQRLAPALGRIEGELARITAEMRKPEGRDSHVLLDELIALSANLEADAVASLYRFAASRAYDEIVAQRLGVIGEQAIPGYETWQIFLSRRMGPAVRTCRAVENRQADLSRKLARAADLLRTRVDVELERQNRDLLKSMEQRTRQQLRLQQTVEGLSVAAVSYYVVGLLSYFAKGLESYAPEFDPALLAAAAVPPVMLAVWLLVRRIRRAHAE